MFARRFAVRADPRNARATSPRARCCSAGRTWCAPTRVTGAMTGPWPNRGCMLGFPRVLLESDDFNC
jgi:hypothetical protein